MDRPYIREALFKGPLIVESTYNEIGSSTITFTCRPQLYLPGAFEEIPIGTAHYPTLDYNGIMGVRGCVAKPLILLTKPGTVKFHYGNPDNFRWIEVVMPEQDDNPRIFIDCEDETIYQVGDDGVKRSINGYCRAGGYTSFSPFPEIPDPYEDYRLTNEDAYNSFYAYWRGADGTVVSSYASVQAYIGDEDGNTSGEAVRTAYDCVVIDVSDQFDSTPTQAQVREAGRAQLLANYSQSILPHVAVSAADAPGVFGQDWSELRLCDTVNIYHPIIGQMAAKIIKTRFDPLQGRYTEITIGTPRRTLPKRLAQMERR